MNTDQIKAIDAHFNELLEGLDIGATLIDFYAHGMLSTDQWCQSSKNNKGKDHNVSEYN
jgi:hypothetical protein